MSVKRDPLTRELQYLRKGPGLTVEKMARCPVLLTALSAGHSISGYQAFETRLHQLGQSRHARALRNAMALGYEEPGSLEDRRRHFAKSESRKSAAAHTKTVVEWEDTAIRELCLQLLNAEDEDGLFLTKRADLHFTTEGRSIPYVDQRIEVVALSSGFETFWIGTTRGTIIEEPTSGERWKLVRSTPGGDEYNVHFARTLQAGESYSFFFREKLRDAGRPSGVEFRSWSFTAPTLEFNVRVRFADEKPVEVWQFSDVLLQFTPGEPTESTRLTPDERGTVYASFRRVFGGGQYGVAWRWARRKRGTDKSPAVSGS